MRGGGEGKRKTGGFTKGSGGGGERGALLKRRGGPASLGEEINPYNTRACWYRILKQQGKATEERGVKHNIEERRSFVKVPVHGLATTRIRQRKVAFLTSSITTPKTH